MVKVLNLFLAGSLGISMVATYAESDLSPATDVEIAEFQNDLGWHTCEDYTNAASGNNDALKELGKMCQDPGDMMAIYNLLASLRQDARVSGVIKNCVTIESLKGETRIGYERSDAPAMSARMIWDCVSYFGPDGQN